MKELPPTSRAWANGGSFLDSVEAVLRSSRSLHVNEEVWHRDALLTSQSFSAQQVFESATLLLHEAPYEEVLGALEPGTAAEKAQNKKLRRSRRLFQIARDGLIITTDKNSSPEYQALRQVCILLGNIPRLQEDDPEQRQLFADSLQVLHEAQYSDDYLHDTTYMLAKVSRLINTDTLVGVDATSVDTPEVYHKLRKDFRRVTNMFVLVAAHGLGDDVSHLAAQGVVLNRVYGARSQNDSRWTDLS